MDKDVLLADISACTVEGNVIKLPAQDKPLQNYPQLKKALITAGAKYKNSSFVFKVPAQEIYDKLVGGESVNTKKELQFYTSDEIADGMVGLLTINTPSKFLEPHAGRGALLMALERWYNAKLEEDADFLVEMEYCEIDTANQVALKESGIDAVSVGADFLDADLPLNHYDGIIANPPFVSGRTTVWIDHVKKMNTHLKPGCKMVVIIPLVTDETTITAKNKKTYHEFLNSEGIVEQVININADAFKKSGAAIECQISVLSKTKESSPLKVVREKKVTVESTDTTMEMPV